MNQALIFDCDGVLVNSEVIYISTEREMLEAAGLRYDLKEYLTRFVGLNDRDFLAALARDYAALGKGAFPDELLPTIRARCVERMEMELIAIPGLTDLLEGHAGPRAVASSSGTALLRRKLAQTGLDEFFQPHIYSADLVENGKPAPDLFLHAADQIGAPAAGCIVIEDSANGVRAGVAAGMTVWGFTGGGHADAGLSGRLAEAGAARVFAHFDEIASSLG